MPEPIDCHWVEDRLVALQDGELSPGETHFVMEHLAGCASCTDLEEALLAATPAPSLVVPAEIQAALEAAVEQAVERALTTPADPPPAPHRPWTRWLRRDRDLSNGSLLAYGFLLAACMGWGLSNWFAVADLEARIAAQEATPVHTLPGTELAPDQYRPASFDAEDHEQPWR